MTYLQPSDIERCASIRHCRRADIEQIVREISEATGIRPELIIGRNQTKIVSHARQLAYYVARRKGLSCPQIAKFFGRDHNTIIHGAREEARRRGEI